MNIISFGLLQSTCRITYDNDVENAFHVYLPNKVVAKFVMNHQRVYVLDPKEVQAIQTVAERASLLTDREREGAFKARNMYHSLHCPPISDLKAGVRQNTFANNPITIEDINNMVKIYGRDVAVMKGKTTLTTNVANFSG